MSGRQPRIWVLLGPRRGDNNQLLALAEGLGVPFETRTLEYNLLRALNGRILGRSLATLTRESRLRIQPPWPDLIIAVGRRSVPVARWIRRQNQGRTRLIRIGNPRLDPKLFDLVITTRQYPVPPGKNVILLPLAMSRYRERIVPSPAEEERLSSWPRPHLLMALGGATKYWQLKPHSVAESARKLCGRAAKVGGTLIIVGSPRTDPEVIDAVRDEIGDAAHCRFIDDGSIRFPVLLNDADENFVTSDSISMMSEAVLTGRPVGLIPIELSSKGRRKLGSDRDQDSHRRDLRQFWGHLIDLGLVGTLDQPRCGEVEDPVETAAKHAKALLRDLVE